MHEREVWWSAIGLNVGVEADDMHENVWAAPSASDFIETANFSVCLNVSGFGETSQPRWRYARSGPHKTCGVERHFWNRVSRTPFDCQAISPSPPANIFSRSADYAPTNQPLCRHGRARMSNLSPRRKTAQAIRASLLASATTATL